MRKAQKLFFLIFWLPLPSISRAEDAQSNAASKIKIPVLSPTFPALDILKALESGEDAVQREYFFSHSSFNAGPSQLQWDPLVAPEYTKSWMVLNIAPENLRRIERNEDEQGSPLL